MHMATSKIIAEALRSLAEVIQAPDDVPALCCHEAAARIDDLDAALRWWLPDLRASARASHCLEGPGMSRPNIYDDKLAQTLKLLGING